MKSVIRLLAVVVITGLVTFLSSCTTVFPSPVCKGDRLMPCLEAQTFLEPLAKKSCEGSGRRVCLVPLGQVPPGVVKHLVDYYQDEYGLTVTILTPASIPHEFVNADREQVDTGRLILFMGELFPEAFEDPDAVLIGITGVDVYIEGYHWRYAFAANDGYEYPKAVISSARMDPAIYLGGADRDLFLSRVRKMFSKYLGLLYYGLAPSDDKRSPMYNNILGPADLDRMEEPLPVR